MGILITARRAVPENIDVLVDLYRKLEKEMVALHTMWPRADGFDEPVEEGFAEALENAAARVYLAELDGFPLGFIFGRSEGLRTQEGDERVVAIRLVFVEEEARGVGLGEVMLDTLLDDFRQSGHKLFDAHVLPGHRLAKNFFESGGFAARTIVMHHDDDR